MEEYKLSNITELQLKQSGVQALADRPNAAQQYGQSGLSAAQLKLWFDKLATLVAKKINELQNAIQGEDATKYIGLNLGEYKTLDDLIKAMQAQDGNFAEDVLKLYPNEGAFEPTSLQSIIYGIAQNAAEIEEDIEDLNGKKLSKVTETATVKRVYGVNESGKQTMIDTSTVASPDAVAKYDGKGVLKSCMTPLDLPGYGVMAYPSEVVNMGFIMELRKHIGAGVRFTMDPETYIIRVDVVNIDGDSIYQTSLDLPLEEVVVGCTYNQTTHKIEIKLKNGTITEIPVADLVNGLVTEAQHKLDIKAVNDKLDAALNACIVDVYRLVGGDYVDYS